MDLLEQAKRKFKTGTIFSNVNLGYTCRNIKIRNRSFRTNSDLSIDLHTDNEIGWYTIYLEGKWATIHNSVNKYELWER